MFTGIVERTLPVARAERSASGMRLFLRVDEAPGLVPWGPVQLGESIAVNGVCLTVAHLEGSGRLLGFDAVPETLETTALGDLRPGMRVNVERSLAAGDRFGGHYVTGHVDGTGRIRSRRREGDQVLFTIETPKRLLRTVIRKGSVAVDGISLTVVSVDRAAEVFSFAAIPHTLAVTNLGERRPGDRVNLETDAIGKWVLHAVGEILGESVAEGGAAQTLSRLLDALGAPTGDSAEGSR